MSKFKISNLSFSLMFICLLNSTLLGIIFPYVIHEANTSVCISLGISYFIGLILIFVFLKIFNFLPDKNIFEKIDYVFPKVISKIVSFILMILVFGITTIIFWRLITFISSEFLIETPNLFICLLIVLPILYLFLYDFDVMSRLSTFCIFLGFFILAFNIISLFQQFDLSNFKPLLNFDFSHLSKSSLVFIFLFLIPAFLTLIIPKDNVIHNEKIGRSIVIAYSINFACIFLVFFTIIAVIGVDIASLFTYPSYIVLKTLNVLSFIHNIENINILIWILFMTYTTAFCLLFLKSGLYNLFRFNKKKLNIISVLGIFIPFISVILYILPYEVYFNNYKDVWIVFAIYVSVFLLLFIIYISGKFKLLLKK